MIYLQDRDRLPPDVKPAMESIEAQAQAAFQQGHDGEGNNLDGVPVGAMMEWPLSSPPSRWLKANGQNVSRTTYATYFKVIGVTEGVGDGSTTFQVPNVTGNNGKKLIIYAGV